MSINAGIEAMNIFGGTAYLNVMKLVEHRGLDESRFINLLMKEKAVALPFEDPITYGVNAAKPIIDALNDDEKDQIELLITCSESGIDFGKSMSTYIHDQLGLNRNCRLFEIKQACYSGTAGLQMALNFIYSQVSPGAKALVVATDISRHIAVDSGETMSEDWSYAEPSSGAGAAALLVSDNPEVFQVDKGANGYYGYEVMDTCRPTPDSEAGNADLSLLSYLDCCENAYLEYEKRVNGVDFQNSFHYLAFHTPFGGMVKGAHRTMMRKLLKVDPNAIEIDFTNRVERSLKHCQRVGNIMGGTVLMALASTIDYGDFQSPKRIGCFSYGSGCCSEFYSGVVTQASQKKLSSQEIEKQLNERYPLKMSEYDNLLFTNSQFKFGTRNVKIDDELIPGAKEVAQGRQQLVLREIKEYHRVYEWMS